MTDEVPSRLQCIPSGWPDNRPNRRVVATNGFERIAGRREATPSTTTQSRPSDTQLHVFTCFTLLRARLLAVKQNITLKLPTETLRSAKVLAAQRGTSLSALLLEKLQDALGDDASYEAARKRAFKALDTGWLLGGTPARRRSHS